MSPMTPCSPSLMPASSRWTHHPYLTPQPSPSAGHSFSLLLNALRWSSPKLKLRDPLSLPVPQQSATLTQAKAAKAAENAAARKVAQEKTAQRKEEARKEKAAAKKAKEEARDAARKKAAEAKKKKAAEPARKNPKVEQ